MVFKSLKIFLAVALVVVVFTGQPAQAASLVLANSPVEVYFSPNGGAQDAIVREISKAKTSILMQAYSFTSAPIAKALVDAKARGVAVAAILDKSQRTEKYSGASFLKNAGIPTYIDAVHAIAHDKIMVLDAETVITGSFNFTKSAEERNAENLLIVRSKDLAKLYSAHWAEHKAHSEAF